MSFSAPRAPLPYRRPPGLQADREVFRVARPTPGRSIGAMPPPRPPGRPVAGSSLVGPRPSNSAALVRLSQLLAQR